MLANLYGSEVFAFVVVVVLAIAWVAWTVWREQKELDDLREGARVMENWRKEHEARTLQERLAWIDAKRLDREEKI